MIKSIYVDGLKSLKELKLELKPGLNVLVGPNGSGKSNILTTFKLISRVNQLEYLNSVGSLGSTEIPKLFDVLDSNKSISIIVEGFVGADSNSKNERNSVLDYTYEFELGYNVELKKKLYFKKQILKLNKYDSKNEEYNNFEVIYENNNFTLKKKDKIFFKDETKFDIIIFYEKQSEIFKYRSIVNELSIFVNYLELIVEQLQSWETFNIDPNIVRANFEKITYPEINFEGDGLSSVLLKVCENKKFEPGVGEDCKKYGEIYSTIISYLKEFLPDIVELNVEYDKNRDKINGIAKFEKSNGRDIELPIDLLSDGSLKWLSLVTAILTKNSMFSLEEPENFLNPKMQQYITELMQETANNNNENSILSTHSETILNLLSPEEIVLTYYENGQTYVKRIENPDTLQKAIEETGFGIGWRYVAGALD